ncbi:hypothetical protein HUT19_24900 [Streptomyces sp. NA02950]|uniref:hypothetical protein n=1 Tax=Streptomyces sp. NA02950 TaxID=2742137 RepID=UPI0015915150|nr:hypothetical protein [Streptomyces sp. NA02950]QKV94588.1 hypothetical protein HUT19_24900 [Streptomyces sp. NA02950]
MWRPPRPGTVAVLRIQATVLLTAIGLLIAGTLLSTGGLTVLTVKPVRTVTPKPDVTDTGTTSPSPPTTSPPTTPPSPPTSPPTSPVTSGPPPPGESPTGMPGPRRPAGRDIAQEQLTGNAPALLTTWIGVITQLIGLATALIGLASAGRGGQAQPQTQPQPADRGGRSGRQARVVGANRPPRSRRPRRR